MTVDEIRDKVRKNEYDYTLHAEIERKAESLTFYQIEEAILEGEIIEQYIPKPPKFVDPWTRSGKNGR